MNVIICCESSGVVREAFRSRGHDAWSCDLLPADDGSPYHIHGCGLAALASRRWDIAICHPPCTHLAVSGARHFAAKRADGRQQAGVELFMSFVVTATQHAVAWAVENPIGIMSTVYRKPDQIIQPWQFGHGETKATCLWLNGLNSLSPTNIVTGREHRIHKMPPSADRWKLRSRTYDGIAAAMADQWGK